MRVSIDAALLTRSVTAEVTAVQAASVWLTCVAAVPPAGPGGRALPSLGDQLGVELLERGPCFVVQPPNRIEVLPLHQRER